MAAPSVSDSAITASLLFAIGLGRTPTPESRALAEELRDTVTQMLQDQGASGSISQALDAVRAGRDAVTSDPSLSLSAARYQTLRSEFLAAQPAAPGRGRNVWPVGASTILKRASGSWSAALQNVGLSASSRARPSGFGSARFTEEQFRAALRDFTANGGQAGFTTSYQSYVDWRKLQQQQGRSDLPSGPSIRNTYGSWSVALERDGVQPGGAEAPES
ncbi:hypothetical protein I2485_00240 [Nesterenkonia sp. E16_7]|uniref:hypothetical protein n=1 Tax=unclassified Nesterenkonia TaxID=2629769 RepID=UPI001A91A6EA|nr:MULTISPECIES: hypothetical protein [unclassified Nesterenkonia]MBO0594826.1 hypothetical protein [Nesterenkonia sp. E16_10]MBO0597075.1 hypothetical protein [Nesterenkonia sp. E16_7]